MKKRVVQAVLLLCLGLVIGCGGKYADVIELNNKFIKIMNNFYDSMEKVDSAESAAAALNKMADAMEKLAPKMREMQDKYPELADPDNVPEELRELEAEAKVSGEKYAQSFMKLMPYMMDAKVQQAQMRMAQSMGDMGQK